MKFLGHELNLRKRLCGWVYYKLAIRLPISHHLGFIGKFSRWLRNSCCRNIFAYCGKGVNIEKGACFGLGWNVRVGDNSGLGVNCVIPDGSVIGKDVMMGPNCYIHSRNHRFDNCDIPMRVQGYSEPKPCIIEDDVWIGRDVTIMVGRHISKGTIIAANSVVTKDFPPYSVIGGNPAKLIKSRKLE